MPVEIILLILSLLPIKDAVVTSSLSKKWRFMWGKLVKLNFDGITDNFDEIKKNRGDFYILQQRYLDQVNGVISTYNHPTVQEFRVHFDLKSFHQRLIDSWLDFAVKKNVEIIDLNFVDDSGCRYFCARSRKYSFPSRLSHRNTGPLFKWPSSRATCVEMVSLKQLFLNNVLVTDEIFQEFLTNSPSLETLSIHGSGQYLINIRVSGPINLKHFEIHRCKSLESIHLSDIDLVSFEYKGGQVDLKLANLPNLSKLLCEGNAGSENKTLLQISSCALSLQDFTFLVYRPQRMFKLDSLPMFPNVKKLTLTFGAFEDVCLLEFFKIAKACPSLESLTIKLLGYTSIYRRRKGMNVATNYRLEHLKLFQILGYQGRVSDLELAAYVIDNAAVLQKIVVDPRFQESTFCSSYLSLEDEECARSSAKRQLIPRTPPSVSLVIL
ncbi:F-box protein At5g03100-like [Bidens hawaiensis]|uniref:F-box protein At5g03100-like n=1 Tax=Bidens hawaiensis TaxID=980011 RepID=UPI00404AF351